MEVEGQIGSNIVNYVPFISLCYGYKIGQKITDDKDDLHRG